MQSVGSIPVTYFARRGADPLEPVPYLLTAAEAARFLRLDETGAKNPEESLLHYRKEFGLKATQVGRCVRYQLPDLIDLLNNIKELNPR